MGTFEAKAAKGGVMFNLKAANGQVIATSEIYNSKDALNKGIASVQKNAPIAGVEDQTVEGFEQLKHPKFEVYKDKAGKFRFRLKARNGEIIAVGEAYEAKESCINGVESVKRNAADAKIVDNTSEAKA